MDYQLRKSSQKQLAIGVVTCVVITVLSLGVCYRLLMQNRELTSQLFNNHQTIITPMVDHEGFSFYGTRGDARYLRLMALSLLNLRLNVSAQTIKDSHDLLLAYSDTHLREKLIEVLDELPSLHKLPVILDYLSEARKFGGATLIGIQNFSQLEANYGAQEARAIWDLVNTTLYFRAPSGSVAEWVQKELGETRLLKFRDQYSYGVDTIRDGVNFSKEDTREKIVSFSDIQNLDDLQCFVSLLGDVPIVKLTLEHKQYETIAAGKIERDVSAIFDNQIEQELNKSGIENKAEAIASNTFNNDKKANTNTDESNKNEEGNNTTPNNTAMNSENDGMGFSYAWHDNKTTVTPELAQTADSSDSESPLDEYQDINNNNPRKIEHEKSV